MYISSSGNLVLAGLSGAVMNFDYEPSLDSSVDEKRRREKEKSRPISTSVLANLETTAPEASEYNLCIV